MKKPVSFVACMLIGIILLCYRIQYSEIKGHSPLNVTTWDALGYYLYLPAAFLHDDIRDLSWFDEIDKKYHLSGGWVYQFSKYKNGNHGLKYLSGVAIIEMPFFFVGHLFAKMGGYDADGFSSPYQYALAFGILFYFFLSLFVLRHILLKYFSDLTTAICLLLLVLATNAINYTAIEPAMSHGPLFPLYVLILYTTIRWHDNPGVIWAALSGFIFGLATICRPTEAVMFLIPLFWNTQNKDVAAQKWAMVRAHKSHIFYVVLFGFIGILPQLIYWKYITGSFIHNVGSAWDFLTPHIRVITGWNKGWFIYTPVTVFFIAGMFFIRKYPFRKTVLWFCLLTIYIIISWRDWRYGGSYSTRALMQSYPVFALAFAAIIERINSTRWKYLFYIACAYLIYVNMFQIKQYYNTVLHYYDMNRRYYSRIYLNSDPTMLDMSLLDTKEWIGNEKKYTPSPLASIDSAVSLNIPAGSAQTIIELDLAEKILADRSVKRYLKIESSVKTESGFDGGYLSTELCANDSVKRNNIRLFCPICQKGNYNDYAFYVYIPDYFESSRLKINVTSRNEMTGTLRNIKVTAFTKK
jgi:hypothetical protein